MRLKLDKYDLSQYVIILTGATDGIGKEMARILSGYNPKRLILPARNKEKGKNLLEYIKSSNGHANNVEIWEMDLADLQSVKNFANKFINEVGELHMLFNNAGVLFNDYTYSEIVKTKDNLEIQFQVNHLAPFLLTLLLLDTLKKSVSAGLPGKIAFTSSLAHEYGEIDFENLNLEKGNYCSSYCYKSYGTTKLMSIITSKELSRMVQNENIAIYLIHPGRIVTNIVPANNILKFFARMFIDSAEQGAINVLYPVLSSENKETGKYYHEGIEKEPSIVVNDQDLSKKLWDVSEQILKEYGMI